MIENKKEVKNIIEGALFAAGEPLSYDRIAALFNEAERPNKEEFKDIIVELVTDYDDRGIELKEVASGFRFQVRQGTGENVSRLWDERAPRYTRALLETLSLIAYRQPITRGEIEDIRGVAVSSSIVKTLMERDWVRVVGHRDVPGRPAMYASTRTFLDYFNLKNLDELPSLSEIRDLDKINEELELSDKAPEEIKGEGEEGAGQQQVAQLGSSLSMPVDDDIDETTLMATEKVDEVLRAVEESFRRPAVVEEPDEQEGAQTDLLGTDETATEAGDSIESAAIDSLDGSTDGTISAEGSSTAEDSISSESSEQNDAVNESSEEVSEEQARADLLAEQQRIMTEAIRANEERLAAEAREASGGQTVVEGLSGSESREEPEVIESTETVNQESEVVAESAVEEYDAAAEEAELEAELLAEQQLQAEEAEIEAELQAEQELKAEEALAREEEEQA